jgi:hypothetical protein
VFEVHLKFNILLFCYITQVYTIDSSFRSHMPFNIPDQVAGRLHSTVSFFILKFVVGFIK